MRVCTLYVKGGLLRICRILVIWVFEETGYVTGGYLICLAAAASAFVLLSVLASLRKK